MYVLFQAKNVFMVVTEQAYNTQFKPFGVNVISKSTDYNELQLLLTHIESIY